MSDDRESYEWADSFWTATDDGYRCRQCAGPVEQWVEQVPCCGSPYECTDNVYVFACDHCRITGDSF